MPTKSEFSFIRALRSAIKTGTLVDEDLIFSNEIERRVQSTESLRLLRGSGLPAGARSFFCPINFAGRRAISAGSGGAGIVDKNYLQFSDLLSYSTAIQQGARAINGIGKLTELESLCCLADVSENFFGYVTSPVVRRELKRTVCGSGSTDLIWPQLTRPLSSNVINTNC